LLYRSIFKRVVFLCIVLSLALTLGTTSIIRNNSPAMAAGEPDLTVTNIALSPSTPAVDESVIITVTIKNQGTSTTGTSQAICYIDDTILNTNTVASINPGNMVTTTFTWKAEPGTHIIRAVADSNEIIVETDETNNAATYTMTSLAPDLIISSITWTPTSPSRGDPVVISVVMKNQGNAQSPACKVNLYIDGAPRGLQDVFGINPGLTATKTYNWVAQPGQHTIKGVADESKQVKEGNEENNELTVTFSTEPPDLTVTNLTWEPLNPSKNDTVTFTTTVKNQGTGRSDACQMAYYIDGDYKSTITVSPLDIDTSSNVTFTWVAQTDMHSVKVIIDFHNMVAESDENNNEYSASFQTTPPDLTISDITWDPIDVGIGDEVTFTVTVTNLGTGRAEASRLGCYVSTSYTGYVSIPKIEAGASYNATFKWTAPSGIYTVSAAADSDNQVVETDEENNRANRTIPIVPPDIYIPDVAWDPLNPAIGDTVTFSANISNQGNGRASSFHVAFYIDDVLLFTDFVASIPADGSIIVPFTWKALNGRHTMKAIADYDEALLETDEMNNETSVVVTPLMPDISVGTITWSPAEIKPGDKTTFSIDIDNDGTLAADASRVTYYIDGLVVGYADIDRLEAGGQTTEYLTWDVIGGNHKITIVVDSNDKVFELDEGNNTKEVSIPLPDLTITDITWSPDKASIGDNVTLTTTVTNQGTGVSQATKVSCYIDGVILTSKDLAEISPGSSGTASFVWAANHGNHEIKMYADAPNYVTEVDETNNEKVTEFSTLTPELLVKAINWSMANPLNSDAVDITITVKNDGTDVAPASFLTYAIDDTEAVGHDVPAIPAGETFVFTISPLLNSGPHTITVDVDTTEQVTELDETNNTLSKTFSTVVPDLSVKSITWPTNIAAGDTVTITVVVENQGKAKADKASLDLYINGALLSSAEIDELNVGVSVSKDFSWKTIAGSQEISAQVVMDGLVAESNEANNSKSRTITLSQAPPVTKEPATAAPVAVTSKGSIVDYWWAFMLLALLIGGGSFFMAYKSFKKK
jgi:subtilase family serine protease